MTLPPPFEVCGGSAVGFDHRMPGRPGGRNNQDAWHVAHHGGVLAGVVCDGCGSSVASEVGALLGARLVAGLAAVGFQDFPGGAANPPAEAGRRLAAMAPAATERLRAILTAATVALDDGQDGRRFGQALEDFGLFTVIGFVAAGGFVAVFSAGDGVYAVNGSVVILDQNNQPAYLGYRLAGTEVGFGLNAFHPAGEVSSLLVGSDGVRDLIRHEATEIPDAAAAVGPLSQFWTTDAFFRNRFAVQRRLAVINRDHGRHPGLLHDDTTLIAARRP